MENAALSYRVALALGARWCQHPLDAEGRAIAAGRPYLAFPSWGLAHCPEVAAPENAVELYDGPDYANEWEETGPLIERYGITVWNDEGQWKAGLLESAPYEGYWLSQGQEGTTPLIAVCNLILALHASGKLPQQEHTVA